MIVTAAKGHLPCVALLAIAASLSACADSVPQDPPQTVRLLTWTRPGPFARNLSEYLTATVPGVRVVPEPTPGSFFVVAALQNGEAELGFSQADVVYMAYRQQIDPGGSPHKELRAIAVLWVNSIFTVVPRESTVRSIGDLRGKRVGITLQGSSGELLARLTLAAHGLTYDDLKPAFYPVDELASRLTTGEIDAAMATGAVPTSSIAELSAAGHVRMVPVEDAVSKQMRVDYPFIKLMRIPPSDIPGRDSDYDTIGADGVLVCRKDLSESLVHALTKAFFAFIPQSLDDPLAAAINPERAAATPIPLHPGAARYYRERDLRR